MHSFTSSKSNKIVSEKRNNGTKYRIIKLYAIEKTFLWVLWCLNVCDFGIQYSGWKWMWKRGSKCIESFIWGWFCYYYVLNSVIDFWLNFMLATKVGALCARWINDRYTILPINLYGKCLSGQMLLVVDDVQMR